MHLSKHQCSTELRLSALFVVWDIYGRVLVTGTVVCAGRSQELLCAVSQLSPPTCGTSGSNTWCAKTAAGQVSLWHPRSNLFVKTCSHQGEEDGHGDRWLEARGWGDDWRRAAEGAVVETWPEGLSEGRSPGQKEVFIGDFSPWQAMPGWGDPWVIPAHGHLTSGNDNSEGLKTTGDLCQAGTLIMKERQRKTSKDCQTEIMMYLIPTACAAHHLPKETRRDTRFLLKCLLVYVFFLYSIPNSVIRSLLTIS